MNSDDKSAGVGPEGTLISATLTSKAGPTGTSVETNGVVPRGPTGTAVAAAGASSGDMALQGTGTQLLKSGYTLDRILSSEGAESDVYVVTKDGREYVYKRYRQTLRDARQLRTQEEMTDTLQQLGELGHEHIVQIFDHGIDDTGHMYEVQEYVRLGSLADWLNQSGGIGREATVAAVKELAEAIHYLHQQNIIHRDIKPGNILVRSRGDDGESMDLVLTDFGISRIVREEIGKRISETRSRTPLYSAPEAYFHMVAAPGDYWSLGMVVLEMLTGSNPYESYDVHVVEQQKQRVHTPLPSDVDKRWRRLIEGLLRIREDKRWGYDEVTRWLGGEDVAVPEESIEELEPSEKVFLRVDDLAYSSPQEWAADALDRPQAWDEAALSLARGYLSEPLKAYYQNRDVGKLNRIGDVLESDYPDRNLKLFYLVYAIDRSLPLSFRGVVLVTQEQQSGAQEPARDVRPLSLALTRFYEAHAISASSGGERVESDELYDRLQGIAEAVVHGDLLSRYYKAVGDDAGAKWASTIETHVHSTSKTANRAPSTTPKSGAGKAKDRPESSDLPAAALTYRMLLTDEYSTVRENLAKTLAARIYPDCDMVANARAIVGGKYEADGETLSLVNDYVQNNGYTPESVLNMLQGTSALEVLWQCFLDLSAGKPCSNPALATGVTQGHLFSHYLEWKGDDQSLLTRIREAERQMDAYETLAERLLACVVLVYDRWDRVIDFVVKKYDGKLIRDDRLDAALNYFREKHQESIDSAESGSPTLKAT